MMNKQTFLTSIYQHLIVSCQAREGWPMYGAEIMAAFAKAAKTGGASAIRATGVENIKAIQEAVDLPIIGINKVFTQDYDVYITPTYESAREILELGIEMIAIDGTQRERPNNETFDSIVSEIRKNYPNVLIMGEISTFEEAKHIESLEIDFLSTTLSGYTEASKDVQSLNLQLIHKIKQELRLPVIAEGKIKTEAEALAALKEGAYSVVVGTSITRPEIITERYVQQLKEINL